MARNAPPLGERSADLVGSVIDLSTDLAIETEALLPVAAAEDVADIPRPAFSTNGGDFHDPLRLCFATSMPERGAKGVAPCGSAVDKVGANQ